MDNKYTFFTMAIIIIMIILSAGHVLNDNMKTRTIEDITTYSVDECKIIRTGNANKQRKKYDLESFKRAYGTKEFKSIKVEADNTTHTYYVCQDASGVTLFTFVDVGNHSDYYIKSGSFDINSDAQGNLYQVVQ